MNSFIIYCPHLNRDIRNILANVPNPQIYTGYPTPKGEDGCLESHKAIVKIAQKNGWDSVFVMEDDCHFTKHFDYNRWCRPGDIGVMIGGSTRTWGAKRVCAGLISVEKFCSAHCILYHSSSYDRVLAAVQPFDQTVGPALLVHPFVAVQAPSYSGILQRQVNYVPDYERHERELAQL